MLRSIGLILWSLISLSTADNPWMSTITDPASAACTASCQHDEIHYLNSTWTSYITPITVGTVIIIIDDKNNKTTTTTSYMTEVIKDNTTYPVSGFFQNGTFIGGSPPSTTQVNYVPLTDFGINSTATVTYPTQFTYLYGTTLKWGGVLNYTSNGIGICTSRPSGPSILPSHTPLASQTATAPYDSNDPYGAYYTLTLALPDWLEPSLVSSIYDSDPQLDAIYRYCSRSMSSPGEPLSSVTALLGTVTSHISGGTSSTSSTSSASPVSTSMMATAPVTSSATTMLSASTATSSATAISSATETSSVTEISPATETSLVTETSLATETSPTQQLPSSQSPSQLQNSETTIDSKSLSTQQTESSATNSCTDMGCVIVSIINSESSRSNQLGTFSPSAISSSSSSVISLEHTFSVSSKFSLANAPSTSASATMKASTVSSAPDNKSTKQSASPFSSSAPSASDSTQSTQQPYSTSSSAPSTNVPTSSANRLSSIGSMKIGLMTIGVMDCFISACATRRKIGFGLFFVLLLFQTMLR